MTLLILLAALVFNLLAQATLKNGITDIRVDSFNFSLLFKVIASPMIWGGGILYGFSFLFYIFALSRGELSRISPISQALTTIGVVLIAVIFFQEPLTQMKILGLLLLIAGTIIISL
ncbi:hypothetical protein [Paenibacillus whitsoniae]|uniref:EamA domain-containing protein n=1 Tax=Paenibacillus whitsoniae TaxID=2496558 RepID=A0A430JAW7_9BACL|nr:hypothetical protein [Paenibacillus whitsoniae]RTE08160.1 hypothetical protein EJQ19_18905 [Paenibacillus whitsoniae]